MRSLTKSLADVNKLAIKYGCVDLTINPGSAHMGERRKKGLQRKQEVGSRRRERVMMRARMGGRTEERVKGKDKAKHRVKKGKRGKELGTEGEARGREEQGKKRK